MKRPIPPITDSEIRVLLERAKREGDRRIEHLCLIALDEGVAHLRASRIREARARLVPLLALTAQKDQP